MALAAIPLLMVGLLIEVATPAEAIEETFQTKALTVDFPARALTRTTMDPHSVAREGISITCNGPQPDHEGVGRNILLIQHTVMNPKSLVVPSLSMIHTPLDLAKMMIITDPLAANSTKMNTRHTLNPLAEIIRLCKHLLVTLMK